MRPYLICVALLNQMLESATYRCIFRAHHTCQDGCPVMEYCLSEENGLRLIGNPRNVSENDIGQGKGRGQG